MLIRKKLRRQPRAEPAESKVKPPDKRLEHFLSLSKDAAKRLSSAGLVWSVALIVSFMVIDSEVSSRLDKIRTSRSNETSLERAANAASADKKPALKEKLHALKASQPSLGAPISFSLPGLTSVPIPPPLAPALWLLVSYLVVLHLAGIRRHAHGYMALALGLTPAEGRAALVAAPYRALLWPMPASNGPAVSAREYADAYGGGGKRDGTAIVIAGSLILAIAQLWMLWVQHTLSTHIKPPWAGPALHVVSLGLIGATLFVLWNWMRRWRVPDAEFLANGKNATQRRDLLRLALGATGAIALGKLIPAQFGPQVTKAKELANPVFAAFRVNPRYRRNPKAPDVTIALRDGIAWNPASKVMHVVRGGRLVDVTSERTRTAIFKNLSPGELATALQRGTARLRPSHATFLVGRALSQADRTTKVARDETVRTLTRPDTDFRLMMDAIRLDHVFKVKANLWARLPRGAANQLSSVQAPNVAIHLYDRLAKLAATSGRPDVIRELVEFMKTAGLSDAFSTRVAKWSDTQSKWWTDAVTRRSHSKA